MLDWLLAHWTEILGFVSGALCVYFAATRNIWTFPIGLASNIVFFEVFFQAQLYADAGLQVVYFGLGIAGWIGWVRGRAVDNKAATERMPRRYIPAILIVALAATALLVWVLVTFTDSPTPVPDAATTTVSLVAQFLLNRRWIENWYVWIAVDVAYIALYLYKELWITAALYLIFIALCVHGLRTWRRAPHDVVAREKEPQSASAI